MPYVIQSQLKGLIPDDFLVQALDDDQDGIADPGVWDQIVVGVSTEIDGLLAMKYPVPFANPAPAVVQAAALSLALWSLYARRGFDKDKNPWNEQANGVRKRLEAIGSGKMPLTPASENAGPPQQAITEPSRLFSESGRPMV
jgi:phage gp36-like protein